MDAVPEDVIDAEQIGVVLRTVPGAGETLKKGERVQLVIGRVPDRLVQVDSLRGQLEADAMAALEAAGCF